MLLAAVAQWPTILDSLTRMHTGLAPTRPTLLNTRGSRWPRGMPASIINLHGSNSTIKVLLVSPRQTLEMSSMLGAGRLEDMLVVSGTGKSSVAHALPVTKLTA